jgi:hypothetical protein
LYQFEWLSGGFSNSSAIGTAAFPGPVPPKKLPCEDVMQLALNFCNQSVLCLVRIAGREELAATVDPKYHVVKGRGEKTVSAKLCEGGLSVS